MAALGTDAGEQLTLFPPAVEEEASRRGRSLDACMPRVGSVSWWLIVRLLPLLDQRRQNQRSSTPWLTNQYCKQDE